MRGLARYRRMTWVFFLTAGVLMWCAGGIYSPRYARAQTESAGIATREGLQKRIGLELMGMTIEDTLRLLAQKGNISIIASKNVEGRVTLFLKDVAIGDALEIILLANNLAYEMRENVLYVMTENEYKQLHGEYFKDKREVKMYTLQYARPDAVFRTLDVMKSDIGELIVDEESGTVVMIDMPEKLQSMDAALKKLDKAQLTRVFSLQYAKAADVVTALSGRLDSKKTGSIMADSRNNQVIVSALSERMSEVEKLIKSLDKKTKQVLIEAKILKIILSDGLDMGVDWNRVWEKGAARGLNFDSKFAPAIGGTSGLANYLQVGVSNDVLGHSYEAVVTMLQEYGETRNLSSPSIVVVNGKEAKIHVGTSEAYVTTTVATGQTTATTAAQVSFMDVGVELIITPTINDDGFVTMEIKPTVSTVDRQLDYMIAEDVTNTVPIISRTSAETTVMVKDGATIIIGGMKKDEKIKKVGKIPLLGSIPILGIPFRKTSDAMEKTEIVVFLTPHIIGGDKSVADEVEPLEDRIWGDPDRKDIGENTGRW